MRIALYLKSISTAILKFMKQHFYIKLRIISIFMHVLSQNNKIIKNKNAFACYLRLTIFYNKLTAKN